MNRASNNMNHMVITPQVYNLLMVSVAMLFIVYGYRACDRFYRTLKLRAAVLSNKLIEIKGVGENLIFLEEATTAHAMGVIHNRQAEPSRQVDCCFIPFKINFVKVLPQDGSYVISVWNAVPCNVYLLINLNVQALKSTDLSRSMGVNDTNSRSSSSLFASSATTEDWVTALCKPFAQAVTSPVLVEGSVEKSNVIRLLPMLSGGGGGGGGESDNMRSVGPSNDPVIIHNYSVLLVPLWSKGKAPTGLAAPEMKIYTTSTDVSRSGVGVGVGMTQSRSAGANQDEFLRELVVDCDVEMGAMDTDVRARDNNPILDEPKFTPLGDRDGGEGLGEGVSSNLTANQISQLSSASTVDSPAGDVNATHTISSFPLTNILKFGLHVLTPSRPTNSGASIISPGDTEDTTCNNASSSSGSVAESMFYCINSDLFSASEVFGTTPSFNNAPVGSSGDGGGEDDGGLGDDDCVICLTDPKEALLLPCRHLCVCRNCFHQIDRCPICRNNFDKYIMLAPHDTEIIDSVSRRGRRSRTKVVRRKVLDIPPYCDDTASTASSGTGTAAAAAKPTVIYNRIHVD